LELKEDQKKQILYEYHDAPLGGHKGINRTISAIKDRYSWPKMK
jgi:hypothetical protein